MLKIKRNLKYFFSKKNDKIKTMTNNVLLSPLVFFLYLKRFTFFFFLTLSCSSITIYFSGNIFKDFFDTYISYIIILLMLSKLIEQWLVV